MTLKKWILPMIMGLIGGIGALSLAGLFMEEEPEPRTQQHERINHHSGIQFANLPTKPASPESSKDFVKAAKMSVDAVVHVKTRYMNQGYQDPLERLLYGPRHQEKSPVRSAGSGVIVSSDGYIVTNNHVVEQATEIKVTMNDGKTYDADLVGRDKATDLALLKVKADALPTVQYGNSDQVEVGEWVLAVGNPFNLTSTVTAGIVSAKARNINLLRRRHGENVFPVESFIQTDAAVNPGNSGGALISSRGELIGINTAIASNTGSYTGYSFAIPVNIVQKVVTDLIEYGKVQRAFIGVRIRDISEKLAQEKSLKSMNGIYVAGLMNDGAAESAGIKEEDVITKVGSVAVDNVPELQGQISKFRPGDKVNVTVRRDGKEKVVEVTLRNKEGNTDLVKKEEKEFLSALGARFEIPSKKEMHALGIDHGVKVTEVLGGKLRKAGIREGFIILEVDRQDVKDIKEIEKILNQKEGEGVLLKGVYPNGIRAYYGLET